jgi:hypothetical protein
MTGLQNAVKRKTGEYERGRELCFKIGPEGLTIWPMRCRSQSVTISSWKAIYWYGARLAVGIEKAAKRKAKR